MKTPSCVTIPGETPIPHNGEGAGGLSYCSRGSVGSNLGCSAWPEAMATAESKTRQEKKLSFDILKQLELNEDIVHGPFKLRKRPAPGFSPMRMRRNHVADAPLII